MQNQTIALARFARGRFLGAVTVAVVVTSACSPPPPRSYDFFLTDSIARDGTLARCDRDPTGAQTDIECANARRAALAVQLEEERARREALERESAAKIEAMRREFEAQRAAREAAEAEAAAQAELALTTGTPPEPVEAAAEKDAAGAAPGSIEPPAAASSRAASEDLPRPFREND